MSFIPLGVLAASGAGGGGSYESIATFTATGGETSFTWSSIPSTYKHLEIRGIARDTIAINGAAGVKMQFNGDTGTNYTRHRLSGDGTNATAAANTGFDLVSLVGGSIGNSSTASTYGASVITISDYASASKNKTVRAFSGSDANTASANFYVVLNSALWLSTAAITSIKMMPGQTAFSAGSTFALYGIKG